MKIELTDPGLYPLVVDDVDWNGVFALLKMHNQNYTFAVVRDLNSLLENVIIFTARRKIGEDKWKGTFNSDRYLT